MKFKILSILLFTICFISCDKTEIIDDIEGQWSLKSLSGGLAGLNCTYDTGDVVWTFSNGSLSIVNNLTGSDLCDSVSADSNMSYSILDSGGSFYLELNNAETGQLIINGDEMTIDQNKYSNGEGADGFFMTFNKD